MRYFRYALVLTGLAAALASCGGEKSAKLRTYELGKKVALGHLIYTVFESQWLTQIGSGPNVRIPQNRFFLIRLSAINSGGEETLIPNLTLEDDKGNSFDESDKGDDVPQWIGFLRQAKPAESVDGNVVFDVPPRHYKLRVTDENGENAALIDIPLSFTAESPDVPVPSAKPDTGASPVISPGKK